MYHSIEHASELWTGKGFSKKDGKNISSGDGDRIEDGALVYSVKKNGIPDKIVYVGPTSQIPKKLKIKSRKNLKNKNAVIPGLVDCHTHLVFAGNRSEEFAQRCAGVSYQEIAQKGGGISTTVNATRAASEDELFKLGVMRLKEAYLWGTRTIEIKSGYGLSLDSEVKVLKVIKKLKIKFPEMNIISTFLGAHAFPKEISKDDYFKSIVKSMLPLVAKKKLADSCDIFVDEGYFDLAQAHELLTQAIKLGLSVKIHADELVNTESAELAVKLGCLSADHLLKISQKGIRALAQSQTVGVLLPATAFYLKSPHAPAREMLSAGVRIALSTDFNPGTSMTLSLPFVMTLAALYLGMSKEEILCATTYNAARALGVHQKKGTLELKKDADFTVVPFVRFEEMYYRFAWNPSLTTF